MVRLPDLAGSVPPSPPSSPLKSFPWMRFVEDIVLGWNLGPCTGLEGGKEKEGRKRFWREVEI